MRRLLVLFALLAVMLGLRLLRAEDATHESALVLAAIGFVLLASFTVAEMGSAITLPRVTGYILTGACLAAFGILSPPVVLEMKMFNTLALGLIAISAGLELSLGQLKKVITTLSATIVGKILLTAPLVGGAFYLFESKLGPLGLQSRSEIIAVSLVMGALALGTSPAIALAIISETKSKGRLSDIVLGASVLKDLVVVVTLAVAVAMARVVLGMADASAGGLSHVFVEIGYSLLAGVALGVLLILYIRYVKAEMLLFVAAMILVVAEVSHLLHLELLLVFIGGGFVVRNFSDYEHDLLDPVQMVSLPVFVVFFTIAGASIDLATTWRILPLALVLCTVRAVGFYVSARLGNAVGKESEAVRENAWLGYLPQAGVTLGLVGLASGQLGTAGPAILTTGMAVVALNLLLGPIALRVALNRAGESQGPSELEAGDEPTTDLDEESSPIERLPQVIQGDFYRVEKRLEHILFEAEQSSLRRWSSYQEKAIRALAEAALSHEADIEGAYRGAQQTPQDIADFAEECREMFLGVRKAVRTLPEVVEVPLGEAFRKVNPEDGFRVSAGKRLAFVKRVLTFDRHPVRRIPVRELARLHYEPRLAELAAVIWASRMRLSAGVLEDISDGLRGVVVVDEVDSRIARRFDEWDRFLRLEVRAVSRRAVQSLAPQVEIVDTPYLRRNEVRASAADKPVRDALMCLEEGTQWGEGLHSIWLGIVAQRDARELEIALTRDLEQLVVGPGQREIGNVLAEFESWKARLCQVGEVELSIPAGAEQGSEARPGRVIAAAFEAFDEDVRGAGAATFEQKFVAFRAALDVRNFSHRVETSVERLAESLVLPRAESPLSSVRRVTEITYRQVEPRKLGEKLLLKNALLAIERAIETAEEAPRRSLRAVLGVLETTRVAVREFRDEVDPEHARTLLGDALKKADAQLDDILSKLRMEEQEALASLRTGLTDQLEALEQLLEREGASLGELVRGHGMSWLIEEATARGHALLGRTRELLRNADRALREAVRSELSVEVQAKFGSGDLDASSVRAFLERHEPDPSLKDYMPHFADGPLREQSQFVAHRELLKDLLDSERRYLAGGPGSALIVGDAGSGRTSLVNLLQHGSYSKTLVRPSPVEWRRRVGLLQALAYELGCRSRPASIERALRGRQALIVIDDLEEWLPLGIQGLEVLEVFLDLVSRTRTTAFWAVTTKSAWFTLFASVTDIAGSFGRVVRLEKVGAGVLREAIERRHEASGLRLKLPSTLVGSLLGRGRPDRDHDFFFALLAHASGGNLQRAFGLWLHMARITVDGRVELRLSRAVMVGLPFVRNLTPEQTALLVLLCRYGPLAEGEFARELCCSGAVVRRQLTLLLGAGLIVDGRDGLLRIKRAWAPFLQEALAEVKAS